IVRVEDLYFYLHRRLLPVRLRRNLRNLAVVLAIGEGVRGDNASLSRTQAGEIILRDVEFYLDVVQVCERHNRASGAAFRSAGKLCRDQFALFCLALQNRATYRSPNEGGVEL